MKIERVIALSFYSFIAYFTIEFVMQKGDMVLFFLCLIFFSIALESFPISSSGHVVLLQKIFETLHLPAFIYKDFDYFLHGPIALIIAVTFFTEWLFILKGLPRTWPIIQKIFLYGVVTDGITVGSYFFLEKNNLEFPLWVGFLITGSLLFSLIFCKRPGDATWNYKNAVVLGIVQSIALLPGISRLGTTFTVARWLGFSARRAFQLSFLIEWPISCAAFLKGSYGLYQKNKIIELLQLNVILVMIVAILVGLLGLQVMKRVIKENLTWIFSMYVLLLAVATFLLY